MAEVQAKHRSLWLNYIKAVREGNKEAQASSIGKLAELKTAALVKEGLNDSYFNDDQSGDNNMQEIQQFIISDVKPNLNTVDIEFLDMDKNFEIHITEKGQDDSLVFEYKFDGSRCTLFNAYKQDGQMNITGYGNKSGMSSERDQMSGDLISDIGQAICRSITEKNPSYILQYEDDCHDLLMDLEHDKGDDADYRYNLAKDAKFE